jgi:hypothetical protein
MVDQNSPTFNYSEKIGFIIGKAIQYIVVAGTIAFIGGNLGGSQLFQPSPNPPGPAPSP